MGEKKDAAMKRNGLIPLQGGYVYGPINSRRLGNSLGINAFPLGMKICSFNCVYCQYGWTRPDTLTGNEAVDGFPDIETVALALKTRMRNLRDIGIDLKYITFAGNGEPTMHPMFPELVDMVTKLRDEYYPEAWTTILSNSTLAYKPRVRDGLNKLDQRIMKLDAGSNELLRRINAPVGEFTIEKIIEGLLSLKNCTLQSLFIQGRTTNADDRSVAEWIENVKTVRPEFVQIYSIDRVPADRDLEIVGQERLKEIAKRLMEETGIKSGVY